MHDSNSTAGPQRPRVRRGLGVLVGAALLVTPLAAAPAASAQGISNVTPQGLAAVVAQLAGFLAQIASGLASQTLPHPLGESAPNSGATCSADYADGISSTLTCIIAQIPSNQKAKIKATKTHGKVSSMRWAK